MAWLVEPTSETSEPLPIRPSDLIAVLSGKISDRNDNDAFDFLHFAA